MNESQEYIAEEYVEHYKEGEISRRGMLRRVAYLTGGAALAVGFLKSLGIDVTADEVLAAGTDATQASQGNAVTVQPDDPDPPGGWIVYQGAGRRAADRLPGRPAGVGRPYPASSRSARTVARPSTTRTLLGGSPRQGSSRCCQT